MGARIGPVALALLLLAGGAGCSKEKAEAKAAAPPAGAGKTAEAAGPQALKLCEHGVPADLCTRCTPELIDVFKAEGDWCEEHALPLSHCKVHNPHLTFTAQPPLPADWCKEHNLPESKCTKCHPNLIAKFVEAGDYCREHGFPESACPFCHPELVRAVGLVPPAEQPFTTKVRLASAETVKEAGIQTQPVRAQRFGRTLDVVGRLDFNQNRLAHLSSRGDALVLEVKVDVGDAVKAGQPLLVFASGSVGADQAQLSAARARVATARATLEREQSLTQKGISAQKDVDEARAQLAQAEAEYEAARSSLGAAGAAADGTGGRYTLTAPFAGTVVARDAVAGLNVGAGHVVLQVADLSTLWAQLDVPEADAGQVLAGQKVTLSLEGVGGQKLEATLTRVGAAVDPATRTVPARVELPNPGGRLKAGTFVRAQIQVAAEHEALLVPRDSIQRAEGRTLVFVRKEEGQYHPTVVELGAAQDDQVEVVKGLSPGDELVTTGAFLLKTEILKDSIGAGCCEEGGGE
ncbi:efflux RND transporter periplasmic adaptor subunit [Hyalangium rubrum]|uniref:Efflux RND transporter periplasmic adaptor subunit n=1 Tax=Hyalangium rubrum TaxID=3103134 RepID=A0ABU5H8S8_9BACT|nr:efflux RND transporter periplasmic adaptor subunit [Hyalangium sp. s54d21]MDY7229880.1 efflux RND transporter periplasmic adaptor subunit [Hyalangium sp. s54d21]